MTEPKPTAFLRDVDGTGSLHPCSPDDPGAIPFISLELAREISSRNVFEEREACIYAVSSERAMQASISALTGEEVASSRAIWLILEVACSAIRSRGEASQ